MLAVDQDKKRRLEEIRKQIEINKNNAIKEIENEQMVPAMWSVSALIDLKAQEGILNKL